MTIVVEHPGQFTTVQDLGRRHLRARGLPTGGAVDAVSLRVANRLAGNAEDAAALECALVGPALRFTATAVVAVCGARAAGVPHCERFVVPRNGRLDLARLTGGAYAYVAVGGGLDVPVVLDARGTDVRLGFGGVDGRPLRKGDRLAAGGAEMSSALRAERKSRRVVPRDSLDSAARAEGSAADQRSPSAARAAASDSAERRAAVDGPLPVVRVRPPVDPADDAPIRIVDGKDAALVRHDWPDAAFTVSPRSDRVGVRLNGPPVACDAPADAASCVVVPGTIQLPGDGTPIVLLADAQTLGGYPQIAHVIAADLPRLAQRRPGRPVRLRRVSLEDAHRAARRQARDLGLLRYGLLAARSVP